MQRVPSEAAAAAAAAADAILPMDGRRE